MSITTGWPRSFSWTGSTIPFPVFRYASMSTSMMSLDIAGWSPRTTSTARVSSGRALNPHWTEDSIPLRKSGLRTIFTGKSLIFSSIVSRSDPRITNVPSTLDETTLSTTVSIIVFSPYGRRSLGFPILLDSPAARITARTISPPLFCVGFDCALERVERRCSQRSPRLFLN
ncbi:hypothetical protein ES703_116310 [subsurface metagenome]